MQEMEEPRPTYLLNRGLYNQPDKSEVLSPSIPQSMQIEGEAVPTDRLGLAEWLVHPEHPLTARELELEQETLGKLGITLKIS